MRVTNVTRHAIATSRGDVAPGAAVDLSDREVAALGQAVEVIEAVEPEPAKRKRVKS